MKFDGICNRIICLTAIVIAFSSMMYGCKKSLTTVCNDGDGLYTHSSFFIGTAAEFDLLQTDANYRSIAISQFNSITPENIFKPTYLQPQQGEFNWTDADSLADFCMANKKRLHGHTLVWHQQLPPWIPYFEGSRNDWDQLLKTHIQTIVAHFKGKVFAWDVLNEAFEEDGTLRNSIWLQKVGSDYIEKAFNYAHSADPGVLLFYNDYNLELNPAKRTAVIAYFNNLRNRGVKIDGIGLQMHLSLHKVESSQIAEAFKQVSDNGYRVHVSELDIALNIENNNNKQATLNEQATLLAEIVTHYKQLPGLHQYGITFWGITDKYSWVRYNLNHINYPLLYDDNYLPKPVYCKLKEIL